MLKSIFSILLLSFAIILTGFTRENRHDTLSPKYLRCENLVDPLGIDIINPRLSWYSESVQKAQKQSAYRILVASTLEKLNSNDGDLWDSKKISSDQSINIIYNGEILSSGMQCFWKVKVWDGIGNESEWSKSARWSIGLLNKTDWDAVWIGLDKAVGNDNTDTEFRRLSARILRKDFNVQKKIRKATAYISGLGLFELHFNGRKIGNQVLAPALSEYPKDLFI